MRGRRALSLVVVSLLLLAIFSTNLRPVHALVHNVGISMVGTTHMRPAIPTVRAEEGTEDVIVTAYNNGTEDESFTVNVYYYNDTLLPQYIGAIPFQLNAPSMGDRNSTEIAISWDISGIAEGTYWVKANTTAVAGDETPGDNEKVSDHQTGIITGHNVGIYDVKGSFPLQVRAGDIYTITIDAFNNGYFNESSIVVTTYYNRSGDPTTFAAINTTNIPFLVNRTGFQTWSVRWNTSGLPQDLYSISANASKVPYEKVDLDQYDFADDNAGVYRHDVAVVDVVAGPTGVNVGDTVEVNVTVQNQGAHTESFNVKAYANDTAVGSPQLVSNLPALADRFRINQTVSPLTSWSCLQTWKDGRSTTTAPYHPVKLDTYAWDNRPEPKDGTWSWADVSNIVVRFDSDLNETADDFEIKIYEIWAYVHTSGGTSNHAPQAHTISGISVTSPSYAYDSDTNTYASFSCNADGYVEFHTFTTGADTITQVDLRIRYSALRVVKVVTFNWDTTAWSPGYYILNGTADAVSGENTPPELELVEDNSYVNLAVRRRVNIPPIHDVAVTWAYTNQTYVEPGDQVVIYATVQNQGDANETFTVTPYYNNTPAASAQLVTVLGRNHTGEDYAKNDTISFTWDTTDVAPGYIYNLWVVASTVGGETDTADNNRTAGRGVFSKLYIDPYRTVSDVSDAYHSWPTTHTISGITVTNPTNAYDQDNATYASYLTDVDGQILFSAFNTTNMPSPETDVARIDLNVRYSAPAVSLPHPNLDDAYRINYTVSPSGSWGVLQDWRDSTVYTVLNDYYWYDCNEPNGGGWDWTDVSNLIVRIDNDINDPNDRSSSTERLRIYEVWAIVNTTTGTFISRPTAHTSATVTSAGNAYDGSSTSFAYFAYSPDGYLELTSFQTSTGTITDVDIVVRYRAYAVTDQYRIWERVLPITSYQTVHEGPSDVDVPLDDYLWTRMLEPNDGNWTWSDVLNLQFAFNSDRRGTAEGREVRIHEIWITIYDKTFSVGLKVKGAEDLWAYDVKISWDPTVLDFVQAAKGDFLSRNYTTTFIVSINYDESYVWVTELITIDAGETGEGLLATLVFRLASTGKSHITLSETMIVDSGQKLPRNHFAGGGKVNTADIYPLTGDFDSDNDVDSDDLSYFAQAYGTTGSPGWDPRDLNSDGVIDAKDLRILGENYW